MGEVKQYKTAGAFRTALETRLQMRAQQERTDLQRLRRQVAFDRFLARLFPQESKGTHPWVLKGGYAMELRIRSARTTKDIDLAIHDGTRLAKDTEERGGKCGRCYKTSLRSNSTTTLSSLWERREKIWTERQKVEAVTLSMLAWTGENSRASTST
jgi:hypothetical protein